MQIYLVTNKVNNKKNIIGQAKDYLSRWNNHINKARIELNSGNTSCLFP